MARFYLSTLCFLRVLCANSVLSVTRAFDQVDDNLDGDEGDEDEWQDTGGGVVSLNLNASGTAKMTSADKLSLKGKQVMIEADSQISLKVGGNFIDIGPTGVSIKGTMVLINSGGAAGSADAASTASSGTPPDPDKPSPPKDPLTPAA